MLDLNIPTTTVREMSTEDDAMEKVNIAIKRAEDMFSEHRIEGKEKVEVPQEASMPKETRKPRQKMKSLSKRRARGMKRRVQREIQSLPSKTKKPSSRPPYETSQGTKRWKACQKTGCARYK